MDATADSPLLFEQEGGIATLTLNRPHRHNALDDEMREAIPRRLAELAADRTLRAVILRGAGRRAFASGADLADIATMNAPAARDHLAGFDRCLRAIEDCPVPVIAMIRGFALGGGCELAAACDFRIAADDARFGVPVARLGHNVDLANVRRLMRLVGPAHTRTLLMTDEILNAAEAHRIGLVNWVLPVSQLEGFTRQLARTIAGKAPLSIRAAKASVRFVEEHPDPAADGENARFVAPLFESADYQEGVAAFFDKREPRFKGE